MTKGHASRLAAPLAALLLSTASAAAAQLPPFDAEAACRRLSSGATPEKASAVMRGCLEIERRAHANLGPAFGAVPDALAEECLVWSSLGGGTSYLSLSVCIDNGGPVERPGRNPLPG